MGALKESLAAFGPNSSDVILFHMAKVSGLRIEDIISSPHRFHECLGKVFGNGGAKTIEQSIFRKIRERTTELAMLEFYKKYESEVMKNG